MGVGGKTKSEQTTQALRWKDPDGQSGLIQPLIVPGLLNNLLGQDLLWQMDAVLTTDNEAFYEDILDNEEANRLLIHQRD